MKELDLSNSWGEWASTVPASLSLQFDKDIKQLWWEDIKQCGEKTEVQRTMRIYKGKYQKRQHHPVSVRKLKYSTGGRGSWHYHFEEQLTDQNLERL